MLRTARFPAVIAALAILPGVVCSQSPLGDIDWRPDSHLVRNIDKSGSDSIRIPLAAHQFVRIEAVQKGADFAVALRDSHGHALIQVDSMNDRYGPETVVAVTESSGDYTLEVKAGDPGDLPARYELRITELREAKPGDDQIVAAHRAYAEAVQLWSHHTADARLAAIEKLKSSLDFFRESGDRYMQALALFSLGTAIAESGDYRKAVPLFQNAAEVFRALASTSEEADAVNSEAGAFDVLGEPQQALRLYQQALDLFRSTGDRSREALLLNNVGWTKGTLAGWQAALDEYGHALELLRTSPNDLVQARVLANMGVAYRQLGELEQAEAFFNQSLPLWKRIGDGRGEATTLGALANVYVTENQPAKALAVQEQALATWRASGDKRGLADALARTARAQAELGQFDAAQASAGESLELARSIHDRRLTGIALAEAARADLLSSHPEKAAEVSEQALVEFRAIGDRTSEALSLETIARAESDRGNLPVARQSMEEALRLTEQNRGATNSDQLRASFFATRQESYAFYADLLMRLGEPEAALQTSERSRARSLLDMLASSGANVREGVDPKLLARERDLSDRLNAKGARLLPLLGRDDPQSAALSAEIRDLQSEYQDVETAIRAASPRYAALTQPAPLTLAEIRRQVLDPDTLLLEYSLGEKTSWMWAVSTDQLHAFALPPRAAIEAQAARVYELLATHRPEAELGPAAKKLNEMVLAPAASVLGNKRLAIVADSALQRIPFAMLSQSSGVREVVMLPSASAIAALRTQVAGRAPAPKLLAVFADPVFDPSDPRAHAGAQIALAQPPDASASRLLEHLAVTQSGGPTARLRIPRLHIPRLPFTSQEAEAILRVADDPSDLKATGFEASRAEALSGVLGQYRYLHFATHGYLDTERPELSALVLAQFDPQGRPVDGFLRVNDIYNSRLSADLVVLSACQTGLGKEVRGEGLMGLTRAFLYAGVPRVIVSLWSVDDRATAELMAAFYRILLRDGKRPSEALLAAQLELRKHKQWQSPYYWAAFVQQGDWK
jgi:CHAT domain-containing protein/Tfp pilus assembly protein PilF